MNIDGLIINTGRNESLVVPIRALAVYQDAIGHPEAFPVIQRLAQILKINKIQDKFSLHRTTFNWTSV